MFFGHKTKHDQTGPDTATMNFLIVERLLELCLCDDLFGNQQFPNSELNSGGHPTPLRRPVTAIHLMYRLEDPNTLEKMFLQFLMEWEFGIQCLGCQVCDHVANRKT